MQSSSCILLVVERVDQVHLALAKALTVARHTAARLELFLCETDPYPGVDAAEAAERSTREHCLQRGREYLRALRDRILCADVAIGDEVAWAPSLIQGVGEKLRRAPAQMVVRAAGRLDAAMAAFARHLVSQSGTSLLLTRGQPWQAVPRFLVVLDSGQAAGAMPRIGPFGELLRRRSGAQMDYVIASTRGLIPLLSERNYDLITLALPPAALGEVDAGTARLLRSTSADLLVVGAAPAVTADAPRSPQPLRSAATKPP